MAKKKIARSRNISKEETNWSINYSFIDVAGPFYWPPETSSTFHKLASLLGQLNKFTLEELYLMRRVTENEAHKRVEITNIKAITRLDELKQMNKSIPGLSEEEPIDYNFLTNNDLLESTYCNEHNNSARIFSLYSNRILYPLWWDPDHEVFPISSKTTINRTCTGVLKKEKECHHPREFATNK